MTRDEVIEKACSYINNSVYSNPNEFTKWFWQDNLAHDWCGAFIKYVFKHDLNCNWLDSCTNFGYVPTIVAWAKEKGYWSNRGQKGDLVVYDWTPEVRGNYEHIGIICDQSSTTLTSVDGNTVNDNYSENCVSKRTRNIKYAVGYINLPYKEDKMEFKVGDRVIINGDLYVSSNADKPTSKVVNKDTYITKIAKNAKHPYNTTGNLGWMNTTDIKLYEEYTDYKKLYEEQLEINKDLNKKIANAIDILK